jgi:hypothetical protein
MTEAAHDAEIDRDREEIPFPCRVTSTNSNILNFWYKLPFYRIFVCLHYALRTYVYALRTYAGKRSAPNIALSK